jgi:glycosyltransferase involved in cell wall biosynthesis
LKVLVIDEWFPWPLESGKKIRTYNLMKRLTRWHDIIYLAYADTVRDTEKVESITRLGIRTIPVEDVRTRKWSLAFYVSVLCNLMSREAFSTTYHVKNTFLEAIRTALNDEDPDAVHCEWTNLAPALKMIQNKSRIIAAHNIESDIWKRLAKNGSNFFERTIGRNQSKKIENLERFWYPRVECCIAVTPGDQTVIESYGGKAYLVDNGVDLEYYSGENREAKKDSLIFTASFDTFSNQDAVDYFVKEVLPIIRRQQPDVTLWLVGKDPTTRIKRYGEGDPKIHVTGTVPDVRDYILNADLCVVPIRIGGGSRLKILEAMALKKAVVSTTVGAEGLRVKHGKNILLADDPADFAAAVSSLLRNANRKRQLSEEGRELVEREYDWEILARRQSEVWNSVGGG